MAGKSSAGVESERSMAKGTPDSLTSARREVTPLGFLRFGGHRSERKQGDGPSSDRWRESTGDREGRDGEDSRVY